MIKMLAAGMVVFCTGLFNGGFSKGESKVSVDAGVFFFKSSVNNQPDELLHNQVFEKWEAIAHQPDRYTVTQYKALDPYPFNLSAGIDAIIRYKKYFMLKIGYCYTNTLGIGGRGSITYVDRLSNRELHESKKMSSTSHQLNYFLGPSLPVNGKGAEVFMGFSMMSPTYAVYHEEFEKTENETVVQKYDKVFTGFFGNCRALIGMQVPLTSRLRIGSELVFAYLNGLEVKSGDLVDEGFQFPQYQWHFTFRYHIN